MKKLGTKNLVKEDNSSTIKLAKKGKKSVAIEQKTLIFSFYVTKRIMMVC